MRLGDAPAILKVPFERDERYGGILMRWWGGVGAARLLRLDEETGTMVIERATGNGDLRSMALGGDDRAAIKILCEVTRRLHEQRCRPRPAGLISLREWFVALKDAAVEEPFARGWQVADRLLAEEREVVALHGDIHHGNVLDFEARGWLAIDPKHLCGERTFDYVNILRNPEPDRIPDARRFAQLVEDVAAAGHLQKDRLLSWTYAFALLSAAWCREDGKEAPADLALADLAGAALGAPNAAPPA